jgi:hypothetical protein
MDFQTEAVVYRVSASDQFQLVNDAWRRFARENGAPDLADSVIGRSLWDYIAGDEVRHVYASLLNRVRREQRGVNFPFRCDSAAVHREMRLFVEPLSGEAIEFRAVFDRQFLQPRRLRPLQSTDYSDTHGFLIMCAWCKAIMINAGWTPLETALEELRLLDRDALPSISHGICRDCLGLAMRL